jgi:hypothetical protein
MHEMTVEELTKIKENLHPQCKDLLKSEIIIN